MHLPAQPIALGLGVGLAGAVVLLSLLGGGTPAAPPGASRLATVHADAAASPAQAGVTPRQVVATDAPPTAAHAPQDRSERYFLRELRTRSGDDLASLRAEILEILATDGPVPERAAALRAWREAGFEPKYAAAEVVLTRDAAPALRDLTIQHVTRRAWRDRTARDLLRSHASRTGSTDVWSRCLYPVLRWGDDRDLTQCVASLHTTLAPEAIVMAAMALRSNASPTALQILDDLRRAHTGDLRRDLDRICTEPPAAEEG